MAEETVRKIIHVDMDAFYASVEQRDNPALRGKPIAVGGSAQRGVVAAASYEARRFGVRSAMPSMTAKQRCPDLIFVKPRFDVYRNVSMIIRDIFRYHTDLIEPLALDEAYLDVSVDKQNIGSGTLIAESIRQDILEQTGLTASAGISYNKFLAKLACEENKPDGIYVITPLQGEAFVSGCKIEQFHGVGPRTAQKMHALNIYTGADLKAWSLSDLESHFGKQAHYFFNAARGVDHRPVKANRVRKSVGAEQTFATDLTTEMALIEAIDQMSAEVFNRSDRVHLRGKTVTLKLKYNNFELVTRQASFNEPIACQSQLHDAAQSLLHKLVPLKMGVRLVGVSISNLVDDEAVDLDPQLPLSF